MQTGSHSPARISPSLRPPLALAATWALALGGLLAYGFVPVSQWLANFGLEWLRGSAQSFQPWVESICFVVLALAFHFSIPPRFRRIEAPKPRPPVAWRSFAVPILIALAFGYARGSGGLASLPSLPEAWAAIAWTVLLAPAGEELLFRGWLYSIAHRVFPQNASPTNPLPMAIWVGALAFSVWHVQNFWVFPWPLVILQLAYTLAVGLWLGWLRWQSGGLVVPWLGHALINLAALIL